MAIHLTPTELAREAGMERRQVIEKCMELGVPIFQGRIDKTLFLANLSDQDTREVAPACPPAARGAASRIALLGSQEEERMQQSTAVPAGPGTGSTTIADLMGLAAERFGDQPAVKFKRDGEWRALSYAEVGAIVSEVGRGLIDLGLTPGDRVALL